jgi:tRNA pseudouridine synthase B
MKGNSIFKSDGIVLLNKSRGISSFKAINKLKWIIGSSKVGHAGTLDPIAEGLLIVMINNATKFSDNLMKRDKEYFVELELGYETDTYDIEGEITEKYEGNINISDEKIIEAVNSFAGEIMQVPPMYSAIKINGEKLYELARKGIEVEREARKVKIYSIREINVDHKEKCRISFYTEVSSGTYIRSLVRDIGRKLGVYATMTRLVRTKIDKYSIEESVLLEEIEEKLGKAKETSGENVCKDISNNMEKTKEIIKFKNIECIFNYEKISVSEEKYKKLKNGMTVLVGFKKFKEIHTVTENKLYCVYVKNEMTEQKEFKGIVKVIRKGHDKVYLKREKYFI